MTSGTAIAAGVAAAAPTAARTAPCPTCWRPAQHCASVLRRASALRPGLRECDQCVSSAAGVVRRRCRCRRQQCRNWVQQPQPHAHAVVNRPDTAVPPRGAVLLRLGAPQPPAMTHVWHVTHARVGDSSFDFVYLDHHWLTVDNQYFNGSDQCTTRVTTFPPASSKLCSAASPRNTSPRTQPQVTCVVSTRADKEARCWHRCRLLRTRPRPPTASDPRRTGVARTRASALSHRAERSVLRRAGAECGHRTAARVARLPLQCPTRASFARRARRASR